jgi:protease secretion system outer membrane protein
VEATRKSVAGGERVNLDVLDAEQQPYSARRDLAQARYDYLRAWLKLRYLAGVLDAGDLNALNGYFAGCRLTRQAGKPAAPLLRNQRSAQANKGSRRCASAPA